MGVSNIHITKDSKFIIEISFDYVKDDYYLIEISLVDYGNDRYTNNDFTFLNKYFYELGVNKFYYILLDQKSELNKFLKNITSFINNNNFIN